MTSDVYLLGVSCTPFGRHPNTTLKELTRTAYSEALGDAGLRDGAGIDGSWFGSSMMGHWGQHLTRGNVCFSPLVDDGLFPERSPVINVEAGCATGSVALLSAAKEILCGSADLTVAVGSRSSSTHSGRPRC